MSSGLYDGGYALLFGDCPWEAGDIRLLLTTSGYTPNTAHATVTDVTDELVGGGYVRKALDRKTVAADRLDASDVVWSGLSAAGAPKYAVLFWEGSGSDAGRQLISWLDLGTPTIPDGRDFRIQWASIGVATLTE